MVSNTHPMLHLPLFFFTLLSLSRKDKARPKDTERELNEERERTKSKKEGKCGIVIKKRSYRSMELSADRTEEKKNLWFLWFHQHD